MSAPHISSISPTSCSAGSASFTLTVTGTRLLYPRAVDPTYEEAAVIRFDGVDYDTFDVSDTSASCTIPSSVLTTARSVTVKVANTDGVSVGSQTFTVNAVAPTLTSISPSTAAVGTSTQITCNGTNFTADSTIRFDGYDWPVTFISSTQIRTQSSFNLNTAGTYAVTVSNSSGTTGSQTLTVTNPAPTITSVSPTSKTVGDAQFTLTITGTGFNSSSQAKWNGTNVTTTVSSSTSISATIPSSLLTTAGTVTVSVVNPAPAGGTATNTSFTLNNPVPTITSLSPSSVTVGAGNTTVTVTGTGIVAGTQVKWNGANVTTTYINSTSCQFVAASSSLSTVGTNTVTLTNAAPAGGTSAGATFTVGNPVPTLTSISPTSGEVGTKPTITVTGTNFVADSVVKVDGNARTTTYVSSTQLTFAPVNSDVLNADTLAITVTNPAPAGGTSTSRTYTVTNPVPVLTSISPTSGTRGSTGTVTLTGSSFNGDSVVKVDGVTRTTTYVNSTTLTFALTAADVSSAGTKSITVFTSSPGGGTSVAKTYTVNNPVPTITSLSPSSLPVNSGSTVVTVTGTGIVSDTVVKWNGTAVTTTYINSTSCSFTATAAMLATVGTYNVTLTNAAPAGGTSAASVFTVANTAPTLTTVTPSSGDRYATGNLTLTGSSFVPDSVANINGNARTTTYVSATELTVALQATDVANAGTQTVTVTNPSPGGGTSASRSYTVNNPAPVLTSLSTSSRTAGSAAFTLTLTGSSFVPESVVRVNGSNRTTTYTSATTISATITAADQATAGTLSITVFNPTPAGGTSAAQTLTINNPAPVLTSLSPSSATKGAAQFTLTVTGSSFVNGSIVRWNGSNRTTTFVNSTTLTATIPATDVATSGTATVTVFNPTPGGGTSAGKTFTINNPVPSITSISPTSANAGSAAFTLTVNGTNFISGSSAIHWNGVAKTTTFVSATTLTATIPATDIETTGEASVTVVTGGTGGGTSNVATFYIGAVNPVPVLSSISPTNKDEGSAAFTLTATGSNFVSGSVIRWNGSNRVTTYVNATTLTASISATDVATPSNVTVSVVNPSPGGGTSGNVTFTVNDLNPVPTLTSISPASATEDTAQFTLTVDGSNFISGQSVVRWNGSNRTTTFVSSTRLTAVIPATDLVNAGTATVTVHTPPAGGGTSTGATFTINAVANNPVPSVTSISPSTAEQNSTGINVTITGTGFIAGSQARWKGSNRTTTYVNATTLTMAVTTADLTVSGAADITVFNTTPGGGVSNAQTFNVLTPANPVPTITSLSPPSVPRGNAAFTLSVTGTGMIPSTEVLLDGIEHTTTYVSPTRVDALVPASDVASASGTVSVINPKANPAFTSVNAEVVRANTAGSATAPALTVGANETTTGLFASAPATLDISAGGVHALQVTESAIEVKTALVAPTPETTANDTRTATTEFVKSAITDYSPVQSVNGQTGAVTVDAAPSSHTHAFSTITSKPTTLAGYGITDGATDSELALKAPLASPALTGTPTAPTAAAGTSTTQIATTAFVTAADNLKAPLASPAFTGTATFEHIKYTGEIMEAQDSTWRHARNVVQYRSGSSALTGAIILHAPDAMSNHMMIGIIDIYEYVAAEGFSTVYFKVYPTAGGVANSAVRSDGIPRPQVRFAYDPTGKFCIILNDVGTVWSYPGIRLRELTAGHTGTVDADFTNWTSSLVTSLTGFTVITTPVDQNETPWTDLSGKPTTLAGYGITDGATDTELANGLALKANLASPAFTGTPTAPTAAAGTSTTQLATTAFVTTADNLKAPLASPALTGTPTAPTAAAGTNTTQIATTAFVTAADNLKAPLASPALTGTPTAPTAAAGTNTTQIATTAFVQAAAPSTLTGTYTFASNATVTASSLYTITVTVTGAAAGDFALIDFSDAINDGTDNLYITGWHVTTNAVQVFVTNTGSTTKVIPANYSVKAKVWKS